MRRDIQVISVIDIKTRFLCVEWSPINRVYFRTMEEANAHVQEAFDHCLMVDPPADYRLRVGMPIYAAEGYGALIRNEDGTREWCVFATKPQLDRFLKTVNG